MQIIVRTDAGADVLLEVEDAFRIEVEINGQVVFGFDEEGPGLFDPEGGGYRPMPLRYGRL